MESVGMNLEELVRSCREKNASDIHICGSGEVYIRVYGELLRYPGEFTRQNVENWIDDMLPNKEKDRELIDNRVDLNFCYSLPNTDLRHRVNIFYQRGEVEAVLRILNDNVPSYEMLNLPPVVSKLAELHSGLVLVTGPTGSGKSTTLASMVDFINTRHKKHIITIEDPIEYVYKKRMSLIRQREIGVDVPTFQEALRSALREDPDVILVGEMRDYETISVALTAAETGHLVFSTLHTIGAVATVDRIIDVFPTSSQQQVRTQLASVLQGVVTQALVPRPDKQGRQVATEIMLRNDAIANLIRDDKCHQIDALLDLSIKEGMHTLNWDLARLVNLGKILREDALKLTTNRKHLLELL